MIYQCVLANHCGGVLKEIYLIDPRGTQQFNFDSYRSVNTPASVIFPVDFRLRHIVTH